MLFHSTVDPPEKVRVVFDCGANISITSLFLTAQYPNGRIYSIEPDPGNLFCSNGMSVKSEELYRFAARS